MGINQCSHDIVVDKGGAGGTAQPKDRNDEKEKCGTDEKTPGKDLFVCGILTNRLRLGDLRRLWFFKY